MNRLRQAMIFMETHLSEPLTVEQIAAEAGLSPYHFCRLFRRVRGETVMGCLRRRRLTRAANRLRVEQTPLIELALDAGFQSQQAFHRAFKRMFGITPGAFRRAGSVCWPAPPGPEPTEEETMTTTSEPRIETCPAKTVIGLKMTVAAGCQAEIPGLWRRFRTRYEEIPDRVEGTFYGICYDHTPQGRRFEYLAGVAVEGKPDLPEGLTKLDLPAQRFAIFTHRIANPNLGLDLPKTFGYAYGTWLPQSDYEPARGPDLELYDSRFDPAAMSGEIDLYIPIQEKNAG